MASKKRRFFRFFKKPQKVFWGFFYFLVKFYTAFDTVDHTTLLSVLQTRFGVDGVALTWFKSYLSHYAVGDGLIPIRNVGEEAF